MQNTVEWLKRQELKKQRNKWRWIAALLLVIILAPKLSTPPIAKDPYIARIWLDTIIFDEQIRLDQLAVLKKDPKVKAVLMHIDTPGGGVTASEKIYYALKALATTKPLVCVMNSIAASGGYMAALPCAHIIAHNSTLTGSIGELIEVPNFYNLSNTIGIEFNTVRSGRFKATPSAYEPKDSASLAILQNVVNQGRDFFIKLVLEHRPVPKNLQNTVFDGRILSSQEALEAKLIDELGTEQTALEWLKDQHQIELKTVDYALTPPLTPLQEIIEEIRDVLGSKALLRASHPKHLSLWP